MGTFELNRREFLKTTAAATGAMMLGGRAAWAADDLYGGFRMGAQSYSFRDFDYKKALEHLKALGLNNIEFCAVHFPASAGHEGFADVKQTIDASGVKVVSYGVENFAGDAEANRLKFDFAKAMGLELMTANPMRNAFKDLDALTQEYNVKIAIHNHGPGADYDGVKDTLRAVKDFNPLIGACVDTGHVIRSGEKPHEVIRALGSRVHSLHLKDWIHGGEEQVIGEGDLDLVEVAKALREVNFSGPVMLEFELSPDNPVPGMAKGLENWSKVVTA